MAGRRTKPEKAPNGVPDGVKVSEVPLSDFVQDSANTRRHGDKNKRTIRASLKQFGGARSIVADGNNVVRAGNGTLEQALAEGMRAIVIDPEPDQLVVVRRKDWTPTQAVAYGVQDNRSAMLGEDDPEAIAEIVHSLRSENFPIEALGYDEDEADELEGLLAAPEGGGEPEDAEDSDPQIDRAAEFQKRWQVKPGDLWVIPSATMPGKDHRLLCGDSTKGEAVTRLMDGEKASICFTSPPYNSGPLESITGGPRPKGEKYTSGISDDRKRSDYLGFLIKFTDIALANAKYVFVNMQSLAGNKVALILYMTHFRNHFADVAVWLKTQAGPAMASRVMTSSFELILVLAPEEMPTRCVGTAEFRGTVSNVISGPSAACNEFADVHSATFPVYLPIWAIESFTNAGEIILESFCGTASTMIAAERSGRLCYAMEIAPEYVAVALERLAGMGLEPSRA